MFQSEFPGANLEKLTNARIFPTAIRNPQNSQLSRYTGFDRSEDAGFLNRIFDFDLFHKDEKSDAEALADTSQQWNTKRVLKAKEILPKRRPFKYRSPNQIIANNERYTTNFTNPEILGLNFDPVGAVTSIFKTIWNSFYEEESKKVKRPRMRGANSKPKLKKTTITKDEKDPAVVFFPTNQDSECMDGATGGGFNTFGFLSMMLAAFNLVGVVSNNGNQNNDNNINRNNINNNNNQNVNEATTDTMTMSMGMVIAPPLPPGRMLNIDMVDPTKRERRDLRHLPGLVLCPSCGLNQTRATKDAGQCRYNYEEGGQVAIALVDLVISWIRVMAGYQRGQRQGEMCAMRAICQANVDASRRGAMAKRAAEVGSHLLISHLPLFATKDVPSLVGAARLGRVGSENLCDSAFSSCSQDTWEKICVESEGAWRRV